MTIEKLQLQAVANFILYRTTNHVRHTTLPAGDGRREYISHYMDQLLHEACKDDARLRMCCQGGHEAKGSKRKSPPT